MEMIIESNLSDSSHPNTSGHDHRSGFASAHLHARHGSLVNRIRLLDDEERQLLRKRRKLDEMEALRLRSIKNQLDLLLSRFLRQKRNALSPLGRDLLRSNILLDRISLFLCVYGTHSNYDKLHIHTGYAACLDRRGLPCCGNIWLIQSDRDRGQGRQATTVVQ